MSASGAGAISVSGAAGEVKVTAEEPWLGLHPFTEGVSDYFFGREREIQDLYERVLHRPLTILFGQSGLGKTSLLRAGLVPRLRQAGYHPILIRLVHEGDAEPLERQVLRELASAVSSLEPTALGAGGPDALGAPCLWELFHDPDFGLAGTPSLERLRPVLLFDQFEEVFTLGAAKRPLDARAFLESLACLVENRPPTPVRERLERDDALADRLLLAPQPCKVLLALRDDFLHRLERWRHKMPSLMDNRLELRLLSGPQAFRAVYEPGTRRAVALGAGGLTQPGEDPPAKGPIVLPDTARAIVRFVAGAAPDAELDEIDNVPPLLSLICEQLNARRLAHGLATIQAEALKQSADEVLGDFYVGCFAPHPPALRSFIEDELVSESGFRESVTLDTAVARLARDGVPGPEAALGALVDQRLLIIEPRGGSSRVELTHDILAPVAAASRAARVAREAREEAERRVVERRRKLRTRALLIAIMACLTLAASLAVLHAWRQARVAKEQAEEGKRQASEASMVDLASGLSAWHEDFDAGRRDATARSIDGKTKWHEAVAYFARALDLDPHNRGAALWLHSTLVRGHGKAREPLFSLKHGGPVTSAGFSPDGSRLVTASSDKTARIWDAASGEAVGKPLQHEDGVNSAYFSPDPDGSRIVTASDDGTARIWHAATGEPAGNPLRHGDVVFRASFSPDGSKVVTESADAAQVWDSASGLPLGTPLRHTAVVTWASFSPDGSRVVTASSDGSAQVWEAATGRHLGTLEHSDSVAMASFSPDGSSVVTASADGTARVWDSASGEPVDSRGLLPGSPVRAASFSPDGSRVVMGGGDRRAEVWDVLTGRSVGRSLRTEYGVRNASFSPDGLRVVTLDRSAAQVWSVASGRPLGERLGLSHGRLLDASMSPDGSKVVTAGADGTALVWDVRTDGSLDLVIPLAGVAVSPDASRMIVALGVNSVQVCDLVTGDAVGQPIEPGEALRNAVFSADGSKIISVSVDWSVRVWDAVSGQPLGRPIRAVGEIRDLAVSADSSRLVMRVGDEAARVWDVERGEPVGAPLELGHGSTTLAVTARGPKVLVTQEDDVVQLLDVATGSRVGEPLRLLRDDASIAAQFSPDGALFLANRDDQTIVVREVGSWKPVGRPLEHEARVQSAAFSPDGSRLVTASDRDGTVRIWDVFAGQLVGEPTQYADEIVAATFGPDGSRLITQCRRANGLEMVDDRSQRSRVVPRMQDIARVLDLATPQELLELFPVPPAVRDWARAVAGLRFTEKGELQAIPGPERQRLLAAPGLPPGQWAQLAEWLRSAGPERKLHPKSGLTLREVAERERDAGGLAGLESALARDQSLPLARLLLAAELERNESQFPEDLRDRSVPARAGWLRRYDLDRLPADAAVWARAALILCQQPDAQVGVGTSARSARDEALKAAQHALALDPSLPAAREALAAATGQAGG